MFIKGDSFSDKNVMLFGSDELHIVKLLMVFSYNLKHD